MTENKPFTKPFLLVLFICQCWGHLLCTAYPALIVFSLLFFFVLLVCHFLILWPAFINSLRFIILLLCYIESINLIQFNSHFDKNKNGYTVLVILGWHIYTLLDVKPPRVVRILAPLQCTKVVP